MPNKDDDIKLIEYEPNRNDDEWQSRVIEHTRHGYSMFRIHKADGSVREVIATLAVHLIPETKTNNQKNTKGNLVVYDLENEGWRTVKFDRLIKWKMLADFPEKEKNSSFKES